MFFAFVLSAISLGALVTPVVVSAAGLRDGILVMAFGPFLVGALGYPSLLAIDREAAARTQALAPRVAVLEGLGIFGGASRSILERLAAAATQVEFVPGSVIVREGDAAECLHVLVEGEVEVTASGEGGGPARVLRRMAAPSLIGEIGVLERIPRTATVTAIGACRCEQIDGETLLDALTSAPPSSTLMENARSRLAQTHPSRQPTFATDAG